MTMLTLAPTSSPLSARAAELPFSGFSTSLKDFTGDSADTFSDRPSKKAARRPCGSWVSNAMGASKSRREAAVSSSLAKTTRPKPQATARVGQQGKSKQAMEWTDETLHQALDGNQPAMRELVKHLTPVIQARVARAVMVGAKNYGHDRIQEEVADITQEVFVALFANDARVLRNWDSEKGLSLRNFAGLVAHRQALSILRTNKRNPFTEDPTLDTDFEYMTEQDESMESAAISRDIMRQVFRRMEEQLSPLGRQLFNLIIMQELDVGDVATQTGMSDAAIYAWRSRLAKHLKREYQSIVSETSAPERRA